MKQNILIAAGLIGLGTSPAFAFTLPPMAPDMAKAVKSVWVDQMAAERASTFDTREAAMSTAKTPQVEGAVPEADDAALAGKLVDETVKVAALGDPDLDLAVQPENELAKAGPSEAVMQSGSAPAAAAYPPCRPGAGDDHCIQLYEPGVRAQLAGWNRSASGSDSAMGGPYEPVDTTLAGELGGAESTSLAIKGDGETDAAIGETADAATDAK